MGLFGQKPEHESAAIWEKSITGRGKPYVQRPGGVTMPTKYSLRREGNVTQSENRP